MGRRGFSFPPMFFLVGLFWFLSPATAQMTNRIGKCQTDTLGIEFITSYMMDCENSGHFEVQITGYFAFTLVSVSVSNHTFEKKIMVNRGEMMPVKLPKLWGMKGSTKFSHIVLVKSNKTISVVSVSNKHGSPETTVVYPVSSLGKEYYIVTPPTKSLASYPVISVMTYQMDNLVAVHVKGKLYYLTGNYSTGNRLDIRLDPFQGFQLQGIEDLSGTKIVSDNPVAVLVGQVCLCNNTKCNNVFEQLLPKCSWGTTYIIPPLPWQVVENTVSVTASQNTIVLYQQREQQKNITLTEGSVLQLPVNSSSPVYISANVSVQVVLYSVGAAIPNSSHAFLMNVPDVARHCLMYSISNWEGFENYALMVASASETDAIILDNQRLREWDPVPGTKYSWGLHNLSSDITSHAVEHPSSPFVLLSVGTTGTVSYGIPGSCMNNILTSKCQIETSQIKEQLDKCKNVFLKDSNNEFCSFVNSTLVNLETICAQNTTVSLEEVAIPFGSLLNSSALSAGESKNVGSAVMLLLQSVELAVLDAALKSPKMKRQNVTTESMAISTLLIDTNADSCDKGFRLRAQEDAMDIDCNTVTEDSTAIAFISYSTLDVIINKGIFEEGDLMDHKKLNSRVVKKEEEKVHCVHLKAITGKDIWAHNDCTVVHMNNTHTVCSCNHLSSFALLIGPMGVEDSLPLTIITYVGLTLSLLCLLLTILTFVLCRSIRNVSTSIHLQLCLCLFLADLLFLTFVTHTSNQVACAVTAGLLHYLFLACFTWMFLEGLHLFLTVRNLKVVNYTSASRFKKRYMYPFGYGFPALIVAISAAVNSDGYGSTKHCWLNLKKGFHWSFLGPVCAIILINLTFFIVILWILRDKLSSLNEDVSTLKDTRVLTFKAVAQVFILGCTWSLGLLQIGSAKMVMAYLFTIVNSLQGVFIFLVHCLLNRQVREEYRRWISSTRKPSPTTQTFSLSTPAVSSSPKMVSWEDPVSTLPS
ncbi:adhesion G protein-coupled receptor E1-like isoform X2 [Pelodiscus sinensis]|uniref:adhesion G protein-coupled receptor E1-like isoform X2 n=1 Tax=Pelodiscus sinensis TaxID=13735 RepID=UPI003F6C2A5A